MADMCNTTCPPEHRTPIPPAEELAPLLTPADVAARLNTTPQTVLRWERKNMIPRVFRRGRIVRFRLDDVVAALAGETPTETAASTRGAA